MDEDFRARLAQVVPEILSAENLELKKLADRTITCRDLLRLFKVVLVSSLCLHSRELQGLRGEAQKQRDARSAVAGSSELRRKILLSRQSLTYW